MFTMTKKIKSPTTKNLPAGDKNPTLQAGKNLADKALEQAEEARALPNPKQQPALNRGNADPGAFDEEAEASDKLAGTLQALQNLVERHANELMKLKEELKHKRESLRSVFENDNALAQAQESAQELAQQVKERKSHVSGSPQAITLKTDINELNQQKKELEETLSNHLVQYYSLTNSTSFDTSDGDQWEFKIQAKVKTKKG